MEGRGRACLPHVWPLLAPSLPAHGHPSYDGPGVVCLVWVGGNVGWGWSVLWCIVAFGRPLVPDDPTDDGLRASRCLWFSLPTHHSAPPTQMCLGPRLVPVDLAALTDPIYSPTHSAQADGPPLRKKKDSSSSSRGRLSPCFTW